MSTKSVNMNIYVTYIIHRYFKFYKRVTFKVKMLSKNRLIQTNVFYNFRLLLLFFRLKHLYLSIFITLPHRIWSSIVIMHEKSSFFVSFFRNISKTAETILIKKIGLNHGISVYKKALISEHQKIIFFEIITVLSKYLLFC